MDASKAIRGGDDRIYESYQVWVGVGDDEHTAAKA